MLTECTIIVMLLEIVKNLVFIKALFAHTVQGETQEVKSEVKKMNSVSF
jgi:hypothetical protein